MVALPDNHDGREREWQFEAEDLSAVHRWLMDQPFLPHITIVDGPEKILSDIYFDTPGRAIFNAGYALRIRERDGNPEATMKSLKGGSGALRIREEINEPLSRIDPAALTASTGPVAERIREIACGAELSRFLEIRTQRRVLLMTARESVLAEVALDRTVFPEVADPDSAAILRVEVEIIEGREENLLPLVETLRKSCSLRAMMTSKLEAGLQARSI